METYCSNQRRRSLIGRSLVISLAILYSVSLRLMVLPHILNNSSLFNSNFLSNLHRSFTSSISSSSSSTTTTKTSIFNDESFLENENLSSPNQQIQDPLILIQQQHTILNEHFGEKSSIIIILINLIWEIILLNNISYSKSSLIGAFLQIINLELISTISNSFPFESKSEIFNLIIFNLINYFGQITIYKVLLNPKNEYSNSFKSTTTSTSKLSKTNESDTRDDKRKEETVVRTKGYSKVLIKRKKRHQIKALRWILISIIDGLIGFIMIRTLKTEVEMDLNEYFKRIETDQFFLLKPSSPRLDSESKKTILDSFELKKDRSMKNLQLSSFLTNSGYLFTNSIFESFLSIPTEIEIILKLIILSDEIKLKLISWLIFRKLFNAFLVWIF